MNENGMGEDLMDQMGAKGIRCGFVEKTKAPIRTTIQKLFPDPFGCTLGDLRYRDHVVPPYRTVFFPDLVHFPDVCERMVPGQGRCENMRPCSSRDENDHWALFFRDRWHGEWAKKGYGQVALLNR